LLNYYSLGASGKIHLGYVRIPHNGASANHCVVGVYAVPYIQRCADTVNTNSAPVRRSAEWPMFAGQIMPSIIWSLLIYT